MITIEPANVADLPVINDIYNDFIINTAVTFNLTPWSISEREQWYQQDIIDRGFHLLVAKHQGVVIGFAYNGLYNKKAAYAGSTELTVYKALDSTLKGVGRMLYQRILKQITLDGYHRAYALITQPNSASLKLHQHFEFEQVGLLSQVGKKFGQYHDVAIWQKIL